MTDPTPEELLRIARELTHGTPTSRYRLRADLDAAYAAAAAYADSVAKRGTPEWAHAYEEAWA